MKWIELWPSGFSALAERLCHDPTNRLVRVDNHRRAQLTNYLLLLGNEPRRPTWYQVRTTSQMEIEKW